MISELHGQGTIAVIKFFPPLPSFELGSSDAIIRAAPLFSYHKVLRTVIMVVRRTESKHMHYRRSGRFVLESLPPATDRGRSGRAWAEPTAEKRSPG